MSILKYSCKCEALITVCGIVSDTQVLAVLIIGFNQLIDQWERKCFSGETETARQSLFLHNSRKIFFIFFRIPRN